LTGPTKYSKEGLAAEVSRVLGEGLPYEHVRVTTFLELIGQPDD
jgi:NAD(P)H dehydrogenase (quinone)